MNLNVGSQNTTRSFKTSNHRT